jgi:hypothetical protein
MFAVRFRCFHNRFAYPHSRLGNNSALVRRELHHWNCASAPTALIFAGVDPSLPLDGRGARRSIWKSIGKKFSASGIYN